MSFFGFNTELPRDRGHPSAAPGFGQAPDPFANLSRGPEEDEGIDFEDTYDGLGDQLDEANDDFNDDTFGGASNNTGKAVGKDYDFFGRTAQVSNAIEEDQLLFNRHQAPPKAQSKAKKSGYEKYQKPQTEEYISDLQVNHDLWGSAAQVQPNRPPQLAAAPQRKMLSLEEVEAQMQASRKPATPKTQDLQSQMESLTSPSNSPFQSRPTSQLPPQVPSSVYANQPPAQLRQPHAELPATTPIMPQVLQRPQQQTPPFAGGNTPLSQQNIQSNRTAAARQGNQVPPLAPGQRPPQPNMHGYPPQPVITHPHQLMQLSEADRAAFLLEDAKRAKRNHKIFLLSKDNGLMTPQDKNYITRIQLQQLMAASGNANEGDSDAALSEDFYYQVHRQIRGGPRTNPQQPLSHFAQTYLFQTGGRHGGFNRRNHRGGDNHLQRMEQQVQRAVEAAKQKPKNKQLVIEGSLGKISFSNAKTPKPLLNIKRTESSDPSNKGNRPAQRKDPHLTTNSRRAILKDIEAVYNVLMKMEDEARKEPLPPHPEAVEKEIQKHIEWREGMQKLNLELWTALKVLEPIDPASRVPHPFIAILSYPKGKKAIPRVFRHLSSEQRVIMLTLIVIHLDILDVVRLGQLQPGETQLPTAAREAIDLFSSVVTPSLFMYVSEAPLYNVMGLLGLILDRVHVQAVGRTRVGLSILTMLTSRATLVKEAGDADDAEWQQWTQLYNRLFDTLEPIMGQIFPGSVNTGEDMYVWQFLAAIGSGASPEQQQRLVIAVKDRVMETVTQSKTLPPEMATQRLGNVNLFMRAIGLDVELLA